MSRFRLRSYELSPPGGYPFIDVDGHKFPSVPVIEDQARRVSNYRTLNGKPRASIKESLQDVDAYQCQRLGNMSSFCVPCDTVNPPVALNTSAPIIAPPCHGCGAPVT